MEGLPQDKKDECGKVQTWGCAEDSTAEGWGDGPSSSSQMDRPRPLRAGTGSGYLQGCVLVCVCVQLICEQQLR